jgi:hypothetical protein
VIHGRDQRPAVGAAEWARGVFDGRLGVSGAQPADTLRAALAQAKAAAPAADACGPGGCELTT